MHRHAIASSTSALRCTTTLLVGLLATALVAPGCKDDAPAAPTGGSEDIDVREPVDAAEVTDDAAPDLLEDTGADASDLAGADAADDPGVPDQTDDEPDAVRADVEPDTGPVDPSTIDGGVLVEFVPRSVPEDDGAYPLGIQAGVMTASSARFWTYAPDKETVVLRVWRTVDTIGVVAMVYDAVVEGSEAGYFDIEVAPLAPGTWYSYAFYTQEGDTLVSRSAVGRARTALAPGSLEPVTIAATSCTSRSRAPYEALSLMAEEEYDLVLHLGDMSYNDSAENLEEYREQWYLTLADTGYRDLLSGAGMYRTWDDHEVDNDYNPLTISEERFEAAHAAYLESSPTRSGPNGEIWTSYLWGDTVEFIIMDSRSERQPEGVFGGSIYISPEQMAFVKDRLLNSPAHFRVLLNSVPITNMGPLWDVAAGDRWEGYPAQRNELLDFIYDNDLHNVWFLTGDFHVGFISQIEPEGEGTRLRELAVGPGGNGPNPLGAGLALQPQFVFSTMEDEVSTVITFDPVANTLHVRYRSADGDSLFDGILSDTGAE